MHWFWDCNRLATKEEFQESYKNLLCATLVALIGFGFFSIASVIDLGNLGAAIAWAVLTLIFWIDMIDRKRAYINRFMVEQKEKDYLTIEQSRLVNLVQAEWVDKLRAQIKALDNKVSKKRIRKAA